MARSHTKFRTSEVVAAGRTVSLAVSAAAREALSVRMEPLVAEAEILFSCLVRKQLTFRNASPDLLSWPVAEGLHVAVRPTLYEMCLPDDGGAVPQVVDFPVDDLASLIPKSIEIDYRDGCWTGSFMLG